MPESWSMLSRTTVRPTELSWGATTAEPSPLPGPGVDDLHAQQPRALRHHGGVDGALELQAGRARQHVHRLGENVVYEDLGHGPQADLPVYAPGLEVVDVVVGARGGDVGGDVYVEAGVEQDGQDVFPLGQVGR